MTRPVRMIVLGFVMVLVGGIVLPYLMLPAVGIIPVESMNPTIAFALEIASYGVSVAGLFLGVIGVAMYMRVERHAQEATAPEKRSGPSTHS
ncbi:MAG TPA: hypothetical protein VMT91_08020 [Anaerolineales bacterium]|nr:hypothetical protein [Anaerolineales bacterium]